MIVIEPLSKSSSISSFDGLINELADQIVHGMPIIPIIRDDLIWLRVGEKDVRLLDKLAQDIAAKHFINIEDNPNRDDDFNYVCHRIRDRANIYFEIRELMQQYHASAIILKESFDYLTKIKRFKCFINATFTNFLEDAAKVNRHFNEISTILV